ncbi:MAG: efflux RND transporter periplasmic adaptor subunit [Desulfuromonadales bacterium]|nr:efflux RND transporter periplasmic adaptor subunit [Desulfuromonadales bacterium]
MLRLLISILLILTCVAPVAAKEKKPSGPPPMLVATAQIIAGKAEPVATFVGTVYFARTARVAAEVDGKVRDVYIKDGQSVSKGERLVLLDDELLATALEGVRAGYEQNQVDLEQAQRDYQRIATLHQQDAIATTEFESYSTRVSRLEKLALVLKARLDRLLLEQKKKTIRAPYTGLIIENLVEAGEWVKAGGAVASLADNRNLEVLVNIPAKLINFLQPGREVSVKVAGEEFTATFLTLIPKGDLATRTFSAKFKLAGSPALIEGMEASVILPTSLAVDGLLAPRDAVINKSGRNILYTVIDGAAHETPVQIEGHAGMQVAVSGPGLEAGQQVVTKGNERIRDGQAVRTGN